MTERERDDRAFYTVDRTEGAVAVLQDDRGQEVLVPMKQLPHDVREGDVLSVPIGSDGSPTWDLAVADRAEAARRRQQAEKMLRGLRRRPS